MAWVERYRSRSRFGNKSGVVDMDSLVEIWRVFCRSRLVTVDHDNDILRDHLHLPNSFHMDGCS